MRTQSPDISLEAERAMIEYLRGMTPAQRFQLAMQMSQEVIDASKRAIRREDPEFDEEAVGVAFVAKHYGQELAEKHAAHLAKRRMEAS